MVTTMYLVRHGQTVLNAQGRFRGRQDPPLDETGFAEARAAAASLAGRPLAEVYSGPLLRTRHTAESIGARAGVPISIEHRLIDLDYGDWDNLTEAQAEALAPQAWKIFKEDPRACVAPNGESLADLEDRVSEAVLQIAERHAGEHVVAVSHDLPILVALARISDLRGPETWRVRVPTGSVTRLRMEGGTLSLDGEPGGGP